MILRTKKLKSAGNIKASLNHTFRHVETPNANPDKLSENQILKGADSSDTVMTDWRMRLPDKHMKTAVLAVEYLIAASPEALTAMSRQEQDAYFRDAVAWLEERHGPSNVLSAVVHRDETSPHLTAMVIPLDANGKLNAHKFLGGRKVLSEMLTDFAEGVGEPHGLMRGLKYSRAKYDTMGEFYARLEMVKAAVRLDDLETLKEQNDLVQALFEELERDRQRVRSLLAHSEAGWRQWQRLTAEAKALLMQLGDQVETLPPGQIEAHWYMMTKKAHTEGDNRWRDEFEDCRSTRFAALDAVRVGFRPTIAPPVPAPDMGPRHKPQRGAPKL